MGFQKWIPVRNSAQFRTFPRNSKTIPLHSCAQFCRIFVEQYTLKVEKNPLYLNSSQIQKYGKAKMIKFIISI